MVVRMSHVAALSMILAPSELLACHRVGCLGSDIGEEPLPFGRDASLSIALEGDRPVLFDLGQLFLQGFILLFLLRRRESRAQ